ncbi:hypothetical protein FRC20_008464, partial [Serendipita sp. 405]
MCGPATNWTLKLLRSTKPPFPGPVTTSDVPRHAHWSYLCKGIHTVVISYRDKFDFGAVTVSPCGTNTVLAINSAVRVSGNKPNSGYLCTDVWDPPSPLKQTF